MLPEVFQTKKVSRFLWGAVLLLIAAAFIVPNVDFSLQQDSPRADATSDPFDERVHDFHRTFREEGLTGADPQQALDYAPMIKARALSDIGSMTALETIDVAEKIEEYQPQIASQPDRATRETLRNHRNELIFEDLHRVDDDKAIQAFDDIRNEYIETLGVDPAYQQDVSETGDD